jgi:hypothetical protein
VSSDANTQRDSERSSWLMGIAGGGAALMVATSRSHVSHSTFSISAFVSKRYLFEHLLAESRLIAFQAN